MGRRHRIRVLVDARIDAHDGIGRYTHCAVSALYAAADDDVDVQVLAPTGTRRYSAAEDAELLGAVNASRADVVHLLNYRLPLRPPPVPAVVTVHDIAPMVAPEICFSDADFARYFGTTGLAELLAHVAELEMAGYPATPADGPAHVRYFHAMVHHTLRTAACVVTATRAVARQLTGLRPGVRVRVSPFGVDHLPPPALAATSPSGPFVLFASVARVYKGIDTLAAAYARSRARRSGVGLVLVGPRCTPEDPAAATLAANGVTDALLLGDVADATLAALYRRARLLVHPSRFEGFGFTPLEALSLGTPVLANDVPALREVLGGHAWLVDAGDVQRFTAALDAALDAPDPPAARHARVRHAAGYRWRQHAADLLTLYRAVAEGCHA